MSADPNTKMLDAAITMHEMFLTLQHAGFNEYQALVIISELVRQHRPEANE